MNPKNSWPAVVLASGGMVVVGIMAALHISTDTIALVSGSMVVPVLAALLAAQGAENRSAVQAVQQQTNGNQTRLLDILEAQGKLLAAMPPAAQQTTPDPAPPPESP